MKRRMPLACLIAALLVTCEATQIIPGPTCPVGQSSSGAAFVEGLEYWVFGGLNSSEVDVTEYWLYDDILP